MSELNEKLCTMWEQFYAFYDCESKFTENHIQRFTEQVDGRKKAADIMTVLRRYRTDEDLIEMLEEHTEGDYITELKLTDDQVKTLIKELNV